MLKLHYIHIKNARTIPWRAKDYDYPHGPVHTEKNHTTLNKCF